MIEFENLSEFKAPTAKPRVHTMPYNWGGTGHLVLNDCIYFNRFNTSNIVQVKIFNLALFYVFFFAYASISNR